MARLLRWKGGCAGDLIMYMMYLSGHTIANVKFLDQMSAEGRIGVDFSHTAGSLTETQKIALEQRFREDIDDARLGEEIASLGDVWIKSHYYIDKFDNITLDILPDAQSLPFVILANIIKTDTMKYQRFHPLASKLKDNEIRIKVAFYNVGKDSMDTKITSSRFVHVSDIIHGWDQLNKKLTDIEICVDSSCQQFYERWMYNNRQYFPSSQYIDMVNNKDYDWTTPDLAMVERYALLILSQEKFKIL